MNKKNTGAVDSRRTHRKTGVNMGCIFKPEPLSWADIEDGRGEMIMDEIRDFVSEYCYEPDNHSDDEELANELVFFAEAWEKMDGYPMAIADSYQTAAVLSLIDGAFHTSMARNEIKEKLARSATKHNLVDIVTHVASLYCWYASLKLRVEKTKCDE